MPVLGDVKIVNLGWILGSLCFYIV